MFNDTDPGDVTGLEAVFESRYFRRGRSTAGAAQGGARRAGQDETIFRMEFGDAGRDVAMLSSASGTGGNAPAPRDDGLQPALAATSSTMGPESPAASADTAASGGGGLALPSPTPSQPGGNWYSNKYRVIAVASCVAALVLAGITAQAGQHRPSTVSAQGHRGGGGPRGGNGSSTPTLGAPSTVTPPQGGGTTLIGTGGSGHRSSALQTASSSGVRSGPGGHVAISGAATDEPASGSSPSSGSGSGPGGSTTPPPAGGTNPAAPVATLVASALSSVATSATGATGQVAGSVPGSSPVTGAVNGAVGTAVSGITQAVGSTTS